MARIYIKVDNDLTHYGMLGMRWGKRKTNGKRTDRLTKTSSKSKANNNSKKEPDDHSIKTGKNYTQKFLEKHDGLEMWELDSKEELDLFNDLESSGGFDEYKAQ